MPHVTAKKMEKAKLTERILAKRLIPGVPSAMTELRQQVDSLTADIPFPALVCADGHAAGLNFGRITDLGSIFCMPLEARIVPCPIAAFISTHVGTTTDSNRQECAN